jgi:hypothetical protein
MAANRNLIFISIRNCHASDAEHRRARRTTRCRYYPARIQQSGLHHARKERPQRFVSEVDRAAEQAIIETILEAYPKHAILAEESGSRGDSEFVWIIDPLDGTTNFLHGFPAIRHFHRPDAQGGDYPGRRLRSQQQ